jgi:hypothetical protein
MSQTKAINGPFVHHPRNISARRNSMEDTDRGTRKNSEINMFCITNVTWTDPGANPALRGERQAACPCIMARPLNGVSYCIGMP